MVPNQWGPTPEEPPGKKLVTRRHREYTEHHIKWCWLLDSLEGGDRYKFARYGEFNHEVKWTVQPDSTPGRTSAREPYEKQQTFSIGRHNLIRHPREYPDPREETTSIDEYELRRERTPVPTLVSQAVRKHLSRIYAQEVGRDGPARLLEWHKDVDGAGTHIDAFMRKVVAPLLATLGQIDLHFDHPPAPEGEKVESRADVARLKLDACEVGVILPENIPWWKLDRTGRRYTEVLVREVVEADDEEQASGRITKTPKRYNYRHWTDSDWTLYDQDGNQLDRNEHPFGRVPIVRVFDEKKHRCKNVGQSRYEAIAERQREIYNLISETILANSTQAHPVLQGPEKYLAADSTIPVGPGHVLPKVQDDETGAVKGDWSVVSFPKDGMQNLRQTVIDHREEADRDAAFTKSSGITGVAKSLDYVEGNDLLSEIAETLADCERKMAEYALVVLHDGNPPPADLDAIRVSYPRKYDLQTADEVAGTLARLQQVLVAAGAVPEIESEYLVQIVRLSLPGRTDDDYRRFADDIKSWLATNQQRMTLILPPGSPGALGNGGTGIGERGGTKLMSDLNTMVGPATKAPDNPATPATA